MPMTGTPGKSPRVRLMETCLGGKKTLIFALGADSIKKQKKNVSLIHSDKTELKVFLNFLSSFITRTTPFLPYTRESIR